MRLAPRHDITLVSEYSKDKVLSLIAGDTQFVDANVEATPSNFNGQINPDGFRISITIRTPQNSLPLSIGRVENTSKGSIIFLSLRLFPAAKLYLQFSTILCLLVGCIFFLLASAIKITFIAALIALLNYLILTLNFHRHVDKTISMIKASLN